MIPRHEASLDRNESASPMNPLSQLFLCIVFTNEFSAPVTLLHQ
jgi:hypothetical protein